MLTTEDYKRHTALWDIQRWGPYQPDQFLLRFFNPEEFNELLKRSQEETYLWINMHIELPEKLY
jgi:hypothetical protein